MKLQTIIPLKPQQHNRIDYNSNLMLLGSCFVENIGNKLDYFKFQNLQNPFGILFHPLALENLIVNAINEKKYTDEDLNFYNEQWYCFDAHSKLSSPSKDDLLNNLNRQIYSFFQQLNKSTHVIITLGTAWVYRNIDTDIVVANCHKVPQKKFLKELLSVDEIEESLQSIIALIKSVNINVSIIFTVSPVRHLKDGFIENTQSKSHLISGVHRLVDSRKKLFYFPSYEIMMDELRDYRFYDEDMIHPNNTAINFIWEKFRDVWILDEHYQIMDDIDVVQKGLAHRPFNPNTDIHHKFIKKLEEKRLNLQKLYSHITF